MKGPSQRFWLAAALLVAAAAVAVFVFVPGPSAADGEGAPEAPRVGQRPPSLDGEHLTGPDEVSLDALRGHVVVLAFVSTRCRACHRALAELRTLSAQRRGDGLRVLAVVSEPPERVRDFVEKAELDFAFARVPPETAASYGVEFIPDLFVIDRRGRLQGRVTGSQDADLNALRGHLDRLLRPGR